MNKIMISGRLTNPPKLHEAENSTRCTIFIANNVHWGNEKSTGFYRVTAWGKLAKVVAEHCKVGTEIFITGRLDQHRYKDDNGKTVYDNSIVMEGFDFGGRGAAPAEEAEMPKEPVNGSV